MPHHFGAYSFSAKRDRLKLQELGLLVPVDRWELTTTGQRIASQLPIAAEVSRIAQQLPTSRGDELVALTYRRFPWYATRSEIATRVLSGTKTRSRRSTLRSPRIERASSSRSATGRSELCESLGSLREQLERVPVRASHGLEHLADEARRHSIVKEV